jgi:hypothetical protein
MNSNIRAVTYDGLVERYKEFYMEIKKQNNMKTFKDLEFKLHPNHIGGKQARITFENGYGASIIQTPLSYGGKIGLYELAVLNSEGDICTNTSVSEDGIVGYLREEDVSEVMIRIQNLPTRENTNTDNTTNTK